MNNIRLLIVIIWHAVGQGPYLFFANRIYLVQLQNVPELNVYAFRGPVNAIAVDFDKR